MPQGSLDSGSSPAHATHMHWYSTGLLAEKSIQSRHALPGVPPILV